MVTIIFESHSTTTDNEAHVSSGHYDVELSPLGVQQAKELGQRYKDDRFDAIFCSDLQRSYKTAELAFGNKFRILKDPRLRECDYGDWTRQPSEQIESSRGTHISQPFPNGESYEQTALRVRHFLDDLRTHYDGKRVMIIGHRATQYGLDQWISGKTTYDAVTAPWKWQPGWIYYLWSLPAPYEYRMKYVVWPLTVGRLLPRFEIEGETLLPKMNFHVSLVCEVGEIIERYRVAHQLEAKEAERRVLEIIIRGLMTFKPAFIGYTDEFRLVKEDDAMTIILMCQVSNLQPFYDYLGAHLGFALELPPTHVTLFTLANNKGIGITSEAQLKSRSQVLKEQILNKMRAVWKVT